MSLIPTTTTRCHIIVPQRIKSLPDSERRGGDKRYAVSPLFHIISRDRRCRGPVRILDLRNAIAVGGATRWEWEGSRCIARAEAEMLTVCKDECDGSEKRRDTAKKEYEIGEVGGFE